MDTIPVSERRTQYPELNQIQVDGLREISSIAAGRAAASLSLLLGKKVDMNVPTIGVEHVGKVAALLTREYDTAYVVCFSVEGQMRGRLFFIFPSSESLELLDILTGKEPGETKDLDEMGISAFKELGNILAGSYLNTFGLVVHTTIRHSVPGFPLHMLEAVLEGMVAELSRDAGCAVMFQNQFRVEKGAYTAHLVFIPELKTLDFVLRAAGLGEKEAREVAEAVTPEKIRDQELMKVFKEEVQSLIVQMREDLFTIQGARVPNGDRRKKELSVSAKREPLDSYQVEPCESSSVPQRLFRYAHRIKGASGIVGLTSLRQVAESLEKIFGAVTEGRLRITAELIPLLCESIEACQGMLDEEVVDLGELLQRLERVSRNSEREEENDQ